MPIKTRFNEVVALMDYNIDIITKTLYLGSDESETGEEHGVNAKMAEKAIKGLHLLDRLATNDNHIKIILNNYGGDYYYAMAIYDFIKSCKNKVDIKVYGPAMSAASIILQSATGTRGVSKHSKIMIHHGTITLGETNVTNLNSWSVEYNSAEIELENVYFERIIQKIPEFDRNKLREMLRIDTILNAEETVRLNLADYII